MRKILMIGIALAFLFASVASVQGYMYGGYGGMMGYGGYGCGYGCGGYGMMPGYYRPYYSYNYYPSYRVYYQDPYFSTYSRYYYPRYYDGYARYSRSSVGMMSYGY